MKRYYLLFLIISFFIGINSSLAQSGEVIPRKVVCLDTTSGLSRDQVYSQFSSAYPPEKRERGFYLIFGGGVNPSYKERCVFDRPCYTSLGTPMVCADLVYVTEKKEIIYVDLSDYPIVYNSDYGKDCKIKFDAPPYEGRIIFSAECKIGTNEYGEDIVHQFGGQISNIGDLRREIREDLARYLNLIEEAIAAGRSTSEIVREKKAGLLSTPETEVQQVIEDPCSKEGPFKTFLGFIPTGVNERWIACTIAKVGFGIAAVILDFVAFISKTILKWAIGAATNFQMAFNHVLSGVLNVVARLDPFSRDIGTVVWRTLRDLAYIVLVFSALYAGFIWLFEGKGAAFSLIFNIILVALIINFSYAFVKLVFTIAFQIEDGISGGTKAQFGNFILGALWQGNFIGSWQSIIDKYNLINPKAINYSPGSEALSQLGFDSNIYNLYLSKLLDKIVTTLFDIVNIIAVSLMPLMIAMVISGALAMMIFLFMYRFITVIRLLITSPLAILSLAYPNKGALGKYLPQFPFTFDNWLSEIVKWAVVIPIFMFMVVLGVVFQQNFVSMSQADVSMEDFVFVFIFLLFWFVFSFNVASGLSGVSANIAKAAAAFPGWALGKLAWGIAQRFGLARWGGEGLRNVGKFLEEKVSNAPILKQLAGWQIRSFGKRLQDLGDKVMEKDYLVRNRPRVVEDMKTLWKEFTKNPNQKTWRGFSDYVGGIAKISAFKEDIQKFIEGLQREPSRLSLILQYDTNNDFLKIEPVGEKIDDVFNRLKTAITDYDKPSGQDAFVEFLERSSVDKIKAAFIGLLPNRWSVLERLLNDTRNRIITRDVAPKLVEVVFSIFMTTPEVTNRDQLARWILGNRETLARILTGKRDAEALLQEAVNTFQNQGINP